MFGTLRWVVAGLAAGTGAALLCARYLQPFVYQVPANSNFGKVTTAVACGRHALLQFS
jgi:hypothetical protein